MANQKVSEIKIEEIRVLRCTFEFLGNHICLDFGGKTVNDLDMDLIKSQLVRETAHVTFNGDMVVFEYDDWDSAYDIMRVSRPYSDNLLALKQGDQSVYHDKVFIAKLVDVLFEGYLFVHGMKTTGSTYSLIKKEKEKENGAL